MFHPFEMLAGKPAKRVLEIPVSKISPNKNQPRKLFAKEELSSLCASIQQYGVIQPISVRKAGDGYEIIAGERRFRASVLAGLTTIPALILTADEKESSELALVENVQRQNLDFFEEAEALAALAENYGLTQNELARIIGKNQSTVANKLRLLKFSAEERELLRTHHLTERHARALLRIDETEKRRDAMITVIRGGYTVKKTEDYVERLLKKPAELGLKKRLVLLKDVRIFLNTINHAVEVMRASGVDARSEKTQSNGMIEYVIRIPVENGEQQMLAAAK